MMKFNTASRTFLCLLLASIIISPAGGFNVQQTVLRRGRRFGDNQIKKHFSKAFGKEHPITLSVGITPSGGAQAGKTPSKRKVARHLVPISTALVIGTFSVLEILESVREIAERQLGHAHGIAILAFIRLCRSIAILQTQAEEFEEQVEEIGVQKHIPIISIVGKMIISPAVMIGACILAAFASIVEIIDDLKPGAHHGAALLALSELYYQIRRFRAYRKRRRKPANSTGEASQFRRMLSKVPLGAMISLVAAGYAGVEMYEDIQPGAHHGVAILALAELVENINRSKIIH